MKISKILSIAGSDSGGGAGIQADLKTMTALGCHAMSAVTAITAQNSLGVTAIQPIDIPIVQAQIDAVFSDMGVDAVKVGMLANAEIVNAVVQSMQKWKPNYLVVDPVLRATSGADLGGDGVVEIMIKELFPIATLITPNLFEASAILGQSITQADQLVDAGKAMIALGVKAVLIKGGHLEGNLQELVDVLVYQDPEEGVRIREYRHSRIETKNTHGTGCTLSSAIASYLAQGMSLEEAVGQGVDYVQAGLKGAKGLQIGSGHGPLWHMHSHIQLNT
jgi:hydroxymethylpyrimidine/phosphomethylpyrimidine kinase